MCYTTCHYLIYLQFQIFVYIEIVIHKHDIFIRNIQIPDFNKIIEENQLKAKTILTIKSRPKLTIDEAEIGLELNEGYEFDVDGALPEIADGIAKLAAELEPNGFGENSGSYFISLINEYYKKLISKE